MKKICKNCKYYEDHDCSCDKFILGYCNTVQHVKDFKDNVLVEDDEGWCFYVGEEFGCIHFELKK